MNLRLTLSYDGSDFRGWARQPGLRTVQGALQDALDKRYGGWHGLHVAGRTDAGVHALGQTVSVHVEGGAPAEAAATVLNDALPPDIVVRDAVVVPAAFHARHSARGRAYLYRIRTSPLRSALEAHRALHHPQGVDAGLLDACAAALVGRHDFTAFTPTETEHRDFERTVRFAEWRRHGAELQLVIAADAFLRHMVRTLIGTMLEVGRGDRSLGDFSRLLDGAHRRDAGPTAPPHGLYFAGVRYDGDPEGGELRDVPQDLAQLLEML